eukprot:g2261.t1
MCAGGGEAPPEIEIGGPKVACALCGRKFGADAIARHSKICEKVFQKKRKKFDTTKMRVQGDSVDPALKEFVKDGKDFAKKKRAEDKAKASKKKSKPKWKRERDQFRQAMIDAKEYAEELKAKEEGREYVYGEATAGMREEKSSRNGGSGGRKARSGGSRNGAGRNGAGRRGGGGGGGGGRRGYDDDEYEDDEPEEEEEEEEERDDGLVPCPNCGRTFNATAAERHIPKCKNIRAKPRALMRGSGRAGGAAGGSGGSNRLSAADFQKEKRQERQQRQQRQQQQRRYRAGGGTLRR